MIYYKYEVDGEIYTLIDDRHLTSTKIEKGTERVIKYNINKPSQSCTVTRYPAKSVVMWSLIIAPDFIVILLYKIYSLIKLVRVDLRRRKMVYRSTK